MPPLNRKLLLFLIALVARTGSAQDFNAGLRVGICGSQVNGDGLSGFNKLGLLGGAFVNRHFGDLISLQMEMVFIQKGSRKPTDEFNNFYRMRVHYIEVPLMLHVHFTKKFALGAGPSVGTLIFSEENDQFGAFKGTQPFRKMELAANAGLLYALSERWSFDARYSHSISTIRPFPGSYLPFFDKGQYNVLIQFSLLYEL